VRPGRGRPARSVDTVLDGAGGRCGRLCSSEDHRGGDDGEGGGQDVEASGLADGARWMCMVVVSGAGPNSYDTGN
jgi:hypothetical protein